MNWGIISIALAGIFFIISVVLTIRIKKKKELAWAYKTVKIIGLGTNAPPELQLTYNNKPVNDVYRTYLILFNRGLEPIRENDVTRPVTVFFRGGEILSEPAVRATSNAEIHFLSKRGGRDSIKSNFLYLDHDDGAVIEVIHTEVEHLSLESNIIGAKKIVYKGEFEDIFPKFLNTKSIIMLIMGVIAIVIAVFSILGKLPTTGLFRDVITMVSVLVGFMFALSIMNFLPRYLRSKKFPTWSRNITKVEIPVESGESPPMAYCVRCKIHKTIRGLEFVVLKDGRRAIRGVCPDSGTKLMRIMPS